jgi:hypothetical protein
VGGDAEMTDLRREIKSIDEELDRDHRRGSESKGGPGSPREAR